MNYSAKIQDAYLYLKTKTNLSPKIGIVLGSGLGDLANAVENCVNIAFSEIPHFPASTVEGHDGKVTTMPRLTGRALLTRNGVFIGVAEGTFMTPLKRWLHFSTKKVIGGAELWRLVGFQFVVEPTKGEVWKG